MIRLLDFFRRDRSAVAAKERLQILVAHDRAGRERADYIPLLQKDLIAVIARYVEIDEDKISVEVADDNGCSMLAVNIELPRARSQKPGARSQMGGPHARVLYPACPLSLPKGVMPLAPLARGAFLSAALLEEPGKQPGGAALLDPADHLGPVIAGGLGEDAGPMLDAPAL